MNRVPANRIAFLVLVALSVGTGSFSKEVAAHDVRHGWIVEQPEEIVGYLLFDPATVADRLPASLRFIEVEELAVRGVEWAADYLTDEPARGDWGISFLEMVRAGTFTIDGRAPEWPDDGAAGLWWARVTPSDPQVNLGLGTPLLMLEFWIPDASYVEYMWERGYYGTYGDVRLCRDADGTWTGSVNVDGLNVQAECRPSGPVIGGAGSFAQQVLVPPRQIISADVIQVDLAGHRIQNCEAGPSWDLTGTHPLAAAVMLGPCTYQFGYDLTGVVLDQ